MTHTSHDPQVDTLTASDGGTWRIHTQSSTYEIDLDGGALTRNPGEGPTDGFVVANLRRDRDQVPLRELQHCCVGERMVVVVDVRGDGVDTVRVTTPVTAIVATTDPSPPRAGQP